MNGDFQNNFLKHKWQDEDKENGKLKRGPKRIQPKI